MRSENRTLRFQPPIRVQDQQQNSFISNRSGVSSVHSEHLRKIVEELEIYPSGFAELLKFQERNIRGFKAHIVKEKERVNDDMNVFKTQIIHILEDLRLSLHAQLDRVYQSYIEKYAKFKGEILDINRLKDQMQMQSGALSMLHKSTATSRDFNASGMSYNAHTIQQMENRSQQLKRYHIFNYIAELQKERILPLTDLHREIVILGEYQNGYYQPEQFKQVLGGFKSMIQEEVKRVYENSHLYIRSTQAIVFKQQPKILDQINKPMIQRQDYILAQPQPRPILLKQSQPLLRQNSDNLLPTVTVSQNPMGTPIYGQVSQSQQSVRLNWSQNINFFISNKFVISQDQVVLCGINVGNQVFAFGMKDGNISVVGFDGQVKATLKEHKASICTLALVKIRGKVYLASGSDIGCSKIILWDTTSWLPVQKFQNHKAAVTAIIDLQDSTHMLSGSYDKKINIYNIQQGRFSYTLPTNTTAITGAILTKQQNRVITCGLDKSLNVWQISRNAGKVETLFLQRKIQNDVLICSMVASSLESDVVVVGTKDGKIKIINVEKGEAYKTILCGENYLIQMMLVEREAKPYYPIIVAWPHKEQKLFLVNSETSVVSQRPSNTTLEFGCGVSPKCFFLHKGGAICSVSHNELAKQVTVYRVEEGK